MEPNPASSAEDELVIRQTAPLLPNHVVPPSEPPVQAAAVLMQDSPTPPSAVVTTVSPVTSPDVAAQPQLVSPIVALAAPRKTRRRLSAKLVVIIAMVINLALLAGNGYVYAGEHKSASTTANGTVAIEPAAATQKKPTSTTASPSGDVKTLHYKSDTLNLEFDYPVDWRIASDGSNASIRLTSASFPLEATNGEKSAATINLLIAGAAQSGEDYSFVIDDSAIAYDSEPLTYATPTAQQRNQTNLSFIGFPHDGKAPGIQTIFISGGNAYKAGDKVGSKDYKKVDPRISMYVDLCAGGKCVQALSVSEYSLKTWHTNESLLKARAVIESMRFN